jgi:hypothetical protein
MATFGRQLAGTADTLRGFELVSLRIDDEVAAVRRVPVVLQSGIRAWAYVDSRYAPSDS